MASKSAEYGVTDGSYSNIVSGSVVNFVTMNADELGLDPRKRIVGPVECLILEPKGNAVPGPIVVDKDVALLIHPVEGLGLNRLSDVFHINDQFTVSVEKVGYIYKMVVKEMLFQTRKGECNICGRYETGAGQLPANVIAGSSANIASTLAFLASRVHMVCEGASTYMGYGGVVRVRGTHQIDVASFVFEDDVVTFHRNDLVACAGSFTDINYHVTLGQPVLFRAHYRQSGGKKRRFEGRQWRPCSLKDAGGQVGVDGIVAHHRSGQYVLNSRALAIQAFVPIGTLKAALGSSWRAKLEECAAKKSDFAFVFHLLPCHPTRVHLDCSFAATQLFAPEEVDGRRLIQYVEPNGYTVDPRTVWVDELKRGLGLAEETASKSSQGAKGPLHDWRELGARAESVLNDVPPAEHVEDIRHVVVTNGSQG